MRAAGARVGLPAAARQASRPWRPASLALEAAQPSAVLAQTNAGARSHRLSRTAVVAASGARPSGAVTLSADAYEALSGCQVYQASTGELLDFTSLWSEDDRVVLLELARQAKRDLLPALSAKGVKLYLTSIGTPQRGLEFSEKTGFPPELLLCDPENVTYAALDFKKGVQETFFSYDTPKAIWERMKAGKTEDLKEVLKVWTKTKLWIPPKQDQAFQQGGALVFQGRRLLFAHYDPATSAHVDFQLLLSEATRGL